MRNLFVGVLLFIVLGFSNLVFAQSITLPFECGFEDSLEVAPWSLNYGPNGSKCQDQWMIGNLDFNGGLHSMYISCDTGKTTYYGASPNVVVAYRSFRIDSIPGGKCGVDVSFDWKCSGEIGSTTLGFILVAANRMPLKNLEANATSGALSNYLSKADCTLYGSTSSWQTWISPANKYMLKEKTDYLMIFIWQNSNKNPDKEFPLAACVDNIQLAVSNCQRPKDLVLSSSNDTVIVEWSGTSFAYEVQYRLPGRRWYSIPNIPADVRQENKLVLTNMLQGIYDVRVRGLCDDNYSIWISSNVTCFIPGNLCINYVELDREGVRCQAGTWPSSSTSTTNNYLGDCDPISFGEASSLSRHVVNWRQGLYDGRTDNQLRTIPDDGSMASVRLGNWEVGYENEAIIFEYEVDTAKAKIILLKYAIVLQAPGHGEIEDPYFKLEILDYNNKPIGGKCGDFDFTPENQNIKWNRTGEFVWKDWSSMGVNVADYHGDVVYIRLETRDCLRGGHGGYAYFTLDCMDAAIKSSSCGDKSFVEMEAPDGFRYIWTKRGEPENVLSTERVFEVPSNDTATYDCQVEYLDTDGCGFNLHTAIIPRYPYADFNYEIRPEGCQNKVIFKSNSGVRTKVDGQYVEYDEELETFYWTIDGKDWYALDDTIEYIASNDGETISINLEVGLNNGTCTADTTMTIVVPSIHEHLDTIRETICFGDYRVFNKEFLAKSGTYTEILSNIWGCDSVTVLVLTVLPEIPDNVLYDTICSTSSYLLAGDKITEPGVYEKILKSKKYGCDSVVILNLEVVEPLGVAISDEYRFLCQEEGEFDVELEFEVGKRTPVDYSLLFDNVALANGFEDQNGVELEQNNQIITITLPQDCRPNTYTATLLFTDTTARCGDVSIPVSFDVYYNSSIIDVKFDNLLAVHDAEHNGGFDFSDYEWYRNGVKVEGDSVSFLYLGDGESFTEGDCYYLVLTRSDDGVVMRTCELCPTLTSVDKVEASGIDVSSTLLNKGQLISIENLDKGQVNIYSLTGLLVDSYDVMSEFIEIVAPQQSGFYLLQIVSPEYNVVYKIYVKGN